ncbi:MAG: PEGA domain-containing protein [Labilithrix sp.]|nr:PEGA domain-containing protein [Labilithrix sp.]MCW5814122.1 PEGA domain-containing protein [Labilithrix sp.]
MFARGTRVVVATAIITLCPLTAFAQEEPSSADVSAARALGQEGVKLADAGNCQDAIEKLARSEKLFHAPTTLARLGECQVQVGKLVEGTENLNKVVRETLAPNAPAAFAAAQERAKKVLAEAKPKIAKLKIAVAGPEGQYVVKLDGEVVPPANLNMNRPTDPGEHEVEASAPGYKTARAKVTLQEGGNDSVALTLEVDPNAPKPEPVVAPAPAPPPVAPPPLPPPAQPEPREQPSRVPAYVGVGVGAAGIAVGTIFGLMATSKKSEIEDQCQGTRCPSSVQGDVDSGRTMGTISTVGFVVGAVGLVAGVYFYLTSSPKTGSTPPGTFVGANGVRLSF